jgi:hypothetical protein
VNPHVSELIRIAEKARLLLTIDGNDFNWSSWLEQSAAIAEVDHILSELRAGKLDSLVNLEVLFELAGPIQETCLSNGWAQTFADLANDFDAVVMSIKNS